MHSVRDSTQEKRGTEAIDPDGGGRLLQAVAIGTMLCMLFVAMCAGMQDMRDAAPSVRVFSGLDMFATLAFAIAGAYSAGSYLRVNELNNLERVLLAIGGGVLTGVGGGFIRDVIVLQTTPVVIVEMSMPPAAALGAALGYYVATAPSRNIAAIVDVLDSIALSVAIMIGTVKAYTIAPAEKIAIVNCIAIVCAY
jgi:uncharacterized membrane protein YeiH